MNRNLEPLFYGLAGFSIAVAGLVLRLDPSIILFMGFCGVGLAVVGVVKGVSLIKKNYSSDTVNKEGSPIGESTSPGTADMEDSIIRENKSPGIVNAGSSLSFIVVLVFGVLFGLALLVVLGVGINIP